MKFSAKHLLQEQYLVPVKIVLVYLAWKLFHHFTLIPGTTLNHFWGDFVYRLGSFYALATSLVLSFFGMKASAAGININLLTSNKQIWVQEHCLAIPAMVVFCGGVIFFRGSFRPKASFLVSGLAGIILINILRLVFLSLAWVYLKPYFFKINHSLIYVLAMYGFIFYMLVKWMDRSIVKSG